LLHEEKGPLRSIALGPLLSKHFCLVFSEVAQQRTPTAIREGEYTCVHTTQETESFVVEVTDDGVPSCPVRRDVSTREDTAGVDQDHVNVGKPSSPKRIERFPRIASDGVQEILLVTSVTDISEIVKDQVNVELGSRKTEPRAGFRTSRTCAPECIEFMQSGTIILTTVEQSLEVLLGDLHGRANATLRQWMGLDTADQLRTRLRMTRFVSWIPKVGPPRMISRLLNEDVVLNPPRLRGLGSRAPHPFKALGLEPLGTAIKRSPLVVELSVVRIVWVEIR
jgi:hypothetical protein